MPAYCDVCGNSGSWFWSKYDNWWNPKIFCSMKCNVVGSYGEHLVIGLILLVFGLITIASFGPILLVIGSISIFMASYGYTHLDYKDQFGGKKDQVDYDMAQKNFDQNMDKTLRDMY